MMGGCRDKNVDASGLPEHLLFGQELFFREWRTTVGRDYGTSVCELLQVFASVVGGHSVIGGNSVVGGHSVIGGNKESGQRDIRVYTAVFVIWRLG